MTKKKRSRARRRLRRKTLMDQLEELQIEWTPFEPATLAQEEWDHYRNSSHDHETLKCVWINSRYQVLVFDVESEDIPGGTLSHLSIKRHDQEPMHDWRDLQRIKSELCGHQREAAELYPDERRLVDTSNQYHLWVLPDGIHFPFGFNYRAVTETEIMGSKQRPFEDKPEDLLSEEDLKDSLDALGYTEDEDND